MDILAVQQRFINAGFQFIEHIFNDGNPRNCSIKFTTSINSQYFTYFSPLGQVGWGRFPRHEAWRKAAEWLDAVEAGEATIPPEVTERSITPLN